MIVGVRVILLLLVRRRISLARNALLAVNSLGSSTCLTFIAGAGRDRPFLSISSSSLKITHGEVVPILLNFELVVLGTRGSKLGSSLSIVLVHVSISHLLISPGV